jgi:hypothetical protein
VIGEGDIGHMITRVLESWTTTDKVKWCGSDGIDGEIGMNDG